MADAAKKVTTDAPTEQPVLIKCVACQHPQSQDHKRCCECGEVMTKAIDAAEYDSVMKAVAAAGQQQAASAGKTPEEEEDEEDDDEDANATRTGNADADLEALKVLTKSHLPEGAQLMDAYPVLKAQSDAGTTMARSMIHIIRDNIGLRGELRLMLKSQGLVMGRLNEVATQNRELHTQNKELREQLEIIGNQRQGRKSALSIVSKSVSPEVAQAAGQGGEQQEPMASDLLIKARRAMTAHPGSLSPLDVDALGSYVRLESSERQLRAMDPELAGRIDAAIARLPG